MCSFVTFNTFVEAFLGSVVSVGRWFSLLSVGFGLSKQLTCRAMEGWEARLHPSLA